MKDGVVGDPLAFVVRAATGHTARTDGRDGASRRTGFFGTRGCARPVLCDLPTFSVSRRDVLIRAMRVEDPRVLKKSTRPRPPPVISRGLCGVRVRPRRTGRV